MVTKKHATLLKTTNSDTESKSPAGLQKRLDALEYDNHKTSHQPVMSNTLKLKLDHLKTFQALTPNQQKFFDAYRQGAYFTGLFGSAGVGKSFIAVYKALEEVLDKSNPFKQLVIVRSAVQGREVGFLPGSLEEKQEIYEQPYKEICATLFERSDAYDRLKEQGYIRFITTTAIRGISIDDSVILLDEAQNCTFQELSSVVTRTGYRSKIMLSGDWRQNDLTVRRSDVSGLSDFMKVAQNMKEFTYIHFTTDDIVRSSLVRSWIISCEEMGL